MNDLLPRKGLRWQEYCERFYRDGLEEKIALILSEPAKLTGPQGDRMVKALRAGISLVPMLTLLEMAANLQIIPSFEQWVLDPDGHPHEDETDRGERLWAAIQ